MSDSLNKPVALVLGGTYPHRELVLNLIRRGYQTILVDYLPNPSAKELADEHIQESTLDVDVVLNIARERHAEIVISVCIDQANVTAARVSEILGLSAPYSGDIAEAVTHKILMKQRMLDHGIPTSRFISGSCLEDLLGHGLQYPLIIKPVDSNSSKGIQQIIDVSQLSSAVAAALEVSRCNELILEEFVEGSEVGVDCYIEDGQAHILISKERRKIPQAQTTEQQIYGCFWPSDLADRHRAEFKVIAESIARAFNLKNSPLMLQAIVNERGINVIEFGARFGGGESFRIIKLATGVDVVDLSIDCFLKRKPKLDIKISEHYYAENFIYVQPSVFDSVGYINGQEPCDELEYLHVYRKSGTPVGEKLSSNNRIGAFAVKGIDHAEVLNKLKQVIDVIEAYDTDGHAIMRKDIYAGSFDC
jgi:biotin carboxylase